MSEPSTPAWRDELIAAVSATQHAVMVALVGPPGSGKSTLVSELEPLLGALVLSSDANRARMSAHHDEADQSATGAAMMRLHADLGPALREGHTVLVDATNARARDRRKLITIAREHDARTVAVIALPSLEVCLERNARRPARPGPSGWAQRAPEAVVENMHHAIETNLPHIPSEGWDAVLRA